MQFRSPGPPPLTSARYTADFEEVKILGSLNSAIRTDDQTLLARFWQSTTPNYIFNHAALELADARHLTFSEKARLLSGIGSLAHLKEHPQFGRFVPGGSLAWPEDENPIFQELHQWYGSFAPR
jgi:hypothetical protein